MAESLRDVIVLTCQQHVRWAHMKAGEPYATWKLVRDAAMAKTARHLGVPLKLVERVMLWETGKD